MSDDETGDELLEKLKQLDERDEVDSFGARFMKAWKNLKIKKGLGHIGLLVSLAVYCGVGGLVSFV